MPSAAAARWVAIIMLTASFMLAALPAWGMHAGFHLLCTCPKPAPVLAQGCWVLFLLLIWERAKADVLVS
jgi:hypothetical protein